jgi:hypothetical protein
MWERQLIPQSDQLLSGMLDGPLVTGVEAKEFSDSVLVECNIVGEKTSTPPDFIIAMLSERWTMAATENPHSLT